MAIREGKWRCPHCGRVERGANAACQGCGATRDENVAFFLEDEAPEVTDEAQLQRARAGAEWLCPYCDTSNPAPAKKCGQCGADREGDRARAVREIPLAPPPVPLAAPAPRSGGCLKWIVVLLVLGFAFCAGLGWLAFRETDEPVTVEALTWSRSVEVEAWQTVREEGWLDERPSGARVVDRWQDVRRTERVQVGTERVKTGVRDLGNGYFEDVYEDRPVYDEREVRDTRARWDVDRWVKVRTERAEGGAGDERHWPELRLGRNEREGGRQEQCLAELRGASRSYRADLGCARWEQLAVGQSFTARVQGGSTVKELN
ncbi:MAG: hypothetical protein KJ067_02535 [Vicinamibacteria bacterium]|jgi:hypothetical protein|nr:hypothetical protein [Vicinamibacteria bacterium]